MRAAVAVILGGILLSGCDTYEWRHSGLGADKADAQLLKCEEKSLKLYPTTVASDVTGGTTKQKGSKCAGLKAGSKAAIECTQGSYKSKGASSRTFDLNRNDRERATKRCMRANGWRRVKIEG